MFLNYVLVWLLYIVLRFIHKIIMKHIRETKHFCSIDIIGCIMIYSATMALSIYVSKDLTFALSNIVLCLAVCGVISDERA